MNGKSGIYLRAMTIVTLIIASPATSPANLCQADLNGDGKVDVQDLTIMRNEMGRDDCTQTPCRSDVNSDGSVNSKDMLIMRSELNGNCFSHDRDMQESATGTLNTKQDRGFERDGNGETTQEEPWWYQVNNGEQLEKKAVAPTSRFNDNGDGTVTDLATGLMWSKNANLSGHTMLLHEALNYIEEMNSGQYENYGFNDWRLPQLKELRSLIDFTRYTQKGRELPQGHPFKNVQSLNFKPSWPAPPTYICASEFPLLLSIYCSLVGRNHAGACSGYIWPVRGGK